METNPVKILVIGAGVNGSIVAVKLHNAGIDVTDALLDFFTSWTTIHITKTDQKFGDFLKARKLTDPQVKILTATTTW